MRQMTFAALMAVWILWVLAFVFRRKRGARHRAATTDRASIVGIVLQSVAYAVLSSRKNAMGGLRIDPFIVTLGLVLGAISVILIWWAIPTLGKQWRVQAGVYEDHELVQSGPYRFVRHPIYSSMLALFLSTGILITPWRTFLISLVVFVIGQEIRVWSEDRLLVERFGKQYGEYRKRVWAYVPFVR